ncbi:LacI family DNA-binding transcriptional regulator [Paenibacillus ihuae]|uniref:LacI family DNA-binding transcriptional regulator n=1 Tax=Paenibacillus ihuae TaxID=1232431 RepID=UPI0006D5621D|nr:LacI family DNA-binding transcriptional regulator [Paenibacillus ihuae]
MTTINDVAKYANLSIATVSRALNKPELVNADTRERVMHAARKLNYFTAEKTQVANLKSRKLTFGVIIPYITEFYFGELYTGISRMAQTQDIHLLLYELNIENMSKDGLTQAYNFAKQHWVDGILLASFYMPADYDEWIEQTDIPVVLLLASHENAKLPAFKVDDIRASFDVVAYLVSRGHRSIGMIAPPSGNLNGGESSRFNGYKQAIDFYRLPFTEQHVAYGNIRYEEGYAAMRRLLSDLDRTGITAVFAATDEMAIGAMRCIHDAGLRVPQDISVIGYDNLTIANMSMPKLTTVEQPFGEIGAEAFKYLVKLASDPTQMPRRGNNYFPHKIIERESVVTLPPSSAADLPS